MDYFFGGEVHYLQLCRGGLALQTGPSASEMTYIVSGGALNSLTSNRPSHSLQTGPR